MSGFLYVHLYLYQATKHKLPNSARVRREASRPEMLTQAWCKFTECVNRYDLVEGSALNSVHLCEAPGAFVAALNHHIQSRCDGSFEWGWVANTLNPYYEGNPTSQVPLC